MFSGANDGSIIISPSRSPASRCSHSFCSTLVCRILRRSVLKMEDANNSHNKTIETQLGNQDSLRTPHHVAKTDGESRFGFPGENKDLLEAPAKNHPFQQRCLPVELEPLAWLAGKWTVFEVGRCHYPTIKDFAYAEQIEFLFTGQKMLDYKSESWNPVNGPETLLHREAGFLRIKPGSQEVALFIAHNFGLTEILEGKTTENKLVLETSGIHRIAFASEPFVLRTRRTFSYNPGTEELEHVMEMQTSRTELTEHLRIKYKRQTHHVPETVRG